MPETEECKDEVAEVKRSFFTDLWTVKLSDIERAFVIAVISGPLFILLDWATMENFEITWKSLVKSAIAGAAYMVKNLITGAQGKVLSNK